jgi:hypothetical protein
MTGIEVSVISLAMKLAKPCMQFLEIYQKMKRNQSSLADVKAEVELLVIVFQKTSFDKDIKESEVQNPLHEGILHRVHKTMDEATKLANDLSDMSWVLRYVNTVVHTKHYIPERVRSLQGKLNEIARLSTQLYGVRADAKLQELLKLAQERTSLTAASMTRKALDEILAEGYTLQDIESEIRVLGVDGCTEVCAWVLWLMMGSQGDHQCSELVAAAIATLHAEVVRYLHAMHPCQVAIMDSRRCHHSHVPAQRMCLCACAAKHIMRARARWLAPSTDIAKAV